MTEAELRDVIRGVLEEYTYKLQTLFVSRDEFVKLQSETRENTTTAAVMRSEFSELRKEVAKLGHTIDRAATWITVSLAGAVLGAVLNLVLR
jgi:hypothetical protein